MLLVLLVGKQWTQYHNRQGSEFIAMASDIRYELMVGGIYPIYYAAMANKWMKDNKVTEEDVASIAAKNKNNAMDNPKAQWYRNEHKYITVDDVMNSRLISYPIKKYDCCLNDTRSCIFTSLF